MKYKFQEHITDTYGSHLKIYTDGSLLEDGNTGAAFFIQSQNIQKQFYIGKHYSILTAELIAIQQALLFLQSTHIHNQKCLLCVDSKSALQILQKSYSQIRPTLIYNIQRSIHDLAIDNVKVTFCWVPSHCGIIGNETVDKAAKHGAQNFNNTIRIDIPRDTHELLVKVNSYMKEKHKKTLLQSNKAYCSSCIVKSNYIN